jgi:hypothetical protein
MLDASADTAATTQLPRSPVNAKECTMSMKKPAAILAGVGTCALAVASCSVSSPQTPSAQSDPGADSQQSAPQSAPQSDPQSSSTAPVLPVGDADTALTSKDGQDSPDVQSGAPAPSGDAEAAEPVVVIVHLEEGADREATLASINEAVAGVYPDATVEVEREYKNALQGYALRVPAGSLDAIRGVSGVKLVSIERETRVQ